MTNEITGQVAVGRFVLQFGEPSGIVVCEAPRTARPRIRPRPAPILVRPGLIRRLLDRREEVASALAAFDAGLPVELSGEPGIGRSAILRYLAHHPRAASFADGIAYVRARHQPFSDLLQLIFETFYETDDNSHPTDAEIRRDLQDMQALILLDDVDLTPRELEQVIDIAPQSTFAVATRERCLWGDVRSIALKGLSPEGAVLLLEHELERVLDASERSAAISLCTGLEGHPGRIKQAAALVRDHGIAVDTCAGGVAPSKIVAELLGLVDEKLRRTLLALTALPAVPLTTQHISGIAGLPDIEPALRTLVRRGLVTGSQSRHLLATGVADQLRRTEDLKPWVNRAITYFAAWAVRYRRSPERLLEDSEALLHVQQSASDARRWGEVVQVGTLLEGALVASRRWGAWAMSLERCLAAAKALGDRSAEAWALHEIGSRAICIEDRVTARRSLTQAVALREAIDDVPAAAVSRQNLDLVLAPAEEPRESMPFSDLMDVDAFPVASAAWPAVYAPATSRGVGTVFLALQMVLVMGLAFLATLAALEGSWDPARIAALLRANGQNAAVADTPVARPVEGAGDGYYTPSAPGPPDPGTPAPPQGAEPERARILIFTPRPGSIASGREPTSLCYAVSGALQARVEPGIGEVPPTSTLTCVRVAPVRTTTYVLDAFGNDGQRVTQQLVIVVKSSSLRRF